MLEPGPIEAPAKSAAARNLIWIASAGVVGVIMLVVGVAGGIWFATHYRIVPLGTTTAPPLAEMALPPGNSSAAPASVGVGGPFTFRFTPGEHLVYRLDAGISGKGIELLNPSGINMQMNALMNLDTQSVCPDGTGRLRLSFADTVLHGDFMESPVTMRTNADQTYFNTGGQTKIDTAHGIGSTQGMPQFDFLKTPVEMEVTRTGEVTQVHGPEGIEGLLAQMPRMAELEFPKGDLSEGAQWSSEFLLPVPGFGDAARARIDNVVQGYTMYNGHRCAVIAQRITSSQQAGTLNSPKSVLGDSMGFSMPTFKLDGTSMVYFDVERGKVVRNDIDLNVKLDIGKALGEAGKMVENLIGQIDSLTGDAPQQTAPGQSGATQQGDLLDLDLNIKAGMTLQDDPAAGSAPLRAQ